MLEPSQFALVRVSCPLCEFPLLLRLSSSEHGVRCPRCRAAPAHMSIASAILRETPQLSGATVYELSSRGPLLRFLRKRAMRVQTSEYFEGVPGGARVNGIECQDVESLTYASESFDLCTSTDVFEHVADDRAGFVELYRVCRPGGRLIFTVPLNLRADTVERAERDASGIRHLLPAEYHDDRLRGPGSVLVFRDYGADIVERLHAAGFTSARIETQWLDAFHGAGRAVVMATRPDRAFGPGPGAAGKC